MVEFILVEFVTVEFVTVEFTTIEGSITQSARVLPRSKELISIHRSAVVKLTMEKFTLVSVRDESPTLEFMMVVLKRIEFDTLELTLMESVDALTWIKKVTAVELVKLSSATTVQFVVPTKSGLEVFIVINSPCTPQSIVSGKS